jgi:propionate CoA-transferase
MVGKVASARDAVEIIRSGDVVASNGYAGCGTPEELLLALGDRFATTGSPRDLTLMYGGGQGDSADRGLNRLGQAGMLKRVIGGHYGLIPTIEQLAVDNEIEAYNFPEGVIIQLYRDIAGQRPGTFSRVGLGTFVDPRIEGGRMNARTTEELVRLTEIDGEEFLFFNAFPIDIAFIRGTTADPDGNVTMEREALVLENLAMALAAKNSGGYVICQVERVAERNSLMSRDVRVPGGLVDCVVIAEPENHMQTYGTRYNPGISGEVRVPLDRVDSIPLDTRKVIARRAALELRSDDIVNLGVGTPDAIGVVANEEKIHDLITLTVDPGVIGGVPLGGLDFGAAVNAQAVIDHASQFDFIDGGGLDACFLGMAECDGAGNINASKFGKRIAGCGGFINLSQNSKRVYFLGTFTSGGLKAEVRDGRLIIHEEGRFRKFLDEIGQITFSAQVAAKGSQLIRYITERCVFELTPDGLELIEVAPGVDVQTQILDLLPFEPIVRDVQPMDPAIFDEQPIGLRDRLFDIKIEDRLSYDPTSNTVFMDYSGMRVRDLDDVAVIKQAVDALLEPIGRRVHSVVNYDRFDVDPEVEDAYFELVRYVQDTYYDSARRYTSDAFKRLQLAQELERHDVDANVGETDSG